MRSRRGFLCEVAAGAGVLMMPRLLGANERRDPGVAQPGEMSMEPKKPEAVARRAFGKTGLEVSILGFGGSEIGFEATAQREVSSILGGAMDAGLNVIDTAAMYRDSEEKIGRAIASRRDQVHLFTKVGHWVPEGKPADYAWTRAGVLESIERSLRQLGTDRLELAQLHSCDIETLKRGEALEGLREAQKQGKVRFVGYSGDGEAAKVAVLSDAFDALQTSINFLDHEALTLTLPLARERRMGVIAKRPIANAVWRYGDELPANTYHHEYWKRMHAVKLPYTFGHYVRDDGPDGAAGVALRWTLFQDAQGAGVHTAIVGTTRPGRYEQNARLLKAGPLSVEVLTDIRQRWASVATAEWVGQR